MNDIPPKLPRSTEVAAIVLYDNGPLLYYTPAEVDCQRGDFVLIDTAKGKELGEVRFRKTLPLSQFEEPLSNVLRLAEPAEIEEWKSLQKRAQDAIARCKEEVSRHKLPMKISRGYYSYQGERLTFFFTAEGRVDFRELVRELAGVFGTRIELRQIGPRDEAKLITGMGTCGRQLCCGTFLPAPLSPSIKQARNQDLNPRNTDKLSGVCGRLKCCLSYEDAVYQSLKKTLPRVTEHVQVGKDRMVIIDVAILKQEVTLLDLDKPRSEVKPVTMSIEEFNQKATILKASGKPSTRDNAQSHQRV